VGAEKIQKMQWPVDASASRGYSRRLHRAMVTDKVAASHGAE
jgi:hypothetical protein